MSEIPKEKVKPEPDGEPGPIQKSTSMASDQ